MLKAKLYDYQKIGIRFAFRNYWTLNGDEQGLGKTVQALGLIAKVGGDHNLIVCPASLQATWRKEIAKFLPDMTSKIAIVSYEKFRKLDPIWLDCIVFDECHYLKNHKAKRTRAAFDWAIGFPPRFLLLLSGTPIKNAITEFFSPIYLLSQTPWSISGERWKYGYWAFCNTFARKEKIYFGARAVTNYKGYRNLERLRRLLQGKYIRRLARNCLDLPAIVRKEVFCEDPKADAKLEEAYKAYNITKSFSTLKADVALAKAEFTADYVAGVLVESPVVVFSDHRESTYKIEEILLERGFKVAAILGGVDPRIRSQHVDSFMGGELDCLILTIGSSSTGLTLTRANHLVFNDLPWVPTDLQQAEKRIHRIGQTGTCFYHYILTGEIDKQIKDTVLTKAKLIKKVATEYV